MYLIAIQFPVKIGSSASPALNPGATNNITLDLKTFSSEIKPNYKAKLAVLAQMNGGSYAELIWSISSITEDFRVTFFYHNPSQNLFPVIDFDMTLLVYYEA